LERQDFDKAIADFTEAIRLKPDDAGAFRLRAVVWFCKDEPDKVITDCTAAIGIDPKKSAYFLMRGHAWSEKCDFGRAIADYTEAITLDPRDYHLYYARGAAWLEKGDRTQASADYATGGRLDPEHTPPPYQLAPPDEKHIKQAKSDEVAAERELRKGDFDAAIEHCNYCVVTNATSAQPYLIRARAWNAKGWQDRAVADLKKFTGLDPRDASAWDLLAQILAASLDEKLRNGNGAVDAASKACELTEWKKPGYLNTLASAYAQAGDFESAVKWQAKAIELEADAKKKEEYRARFKRFQERKPYRDTKP
jgi:tetratricopeptide (TPR) repeat protein